jgi:hypothetical protein
MNSYSVSQLYEFTPEVAWKKALQRNPLVFVGALDEAEFIDMRLSPQRSRVGILCDIRWCRDFEGSNTALVVLTGVGNVSWSNDDHARQRPWHAQYGDWEPKRYARVGPPFPPWTASSGDMWALRASDSLTNREAVDAPSIPEGAREDGLASYTLDFGRVTVSGLAAQIYLGQIGGLDAAPPDMGELSDREIVAGFPQWSSVMEVKEHHMYPEPLDSSAQ